jgi:hypothetical protein
VSRPHSAHDGRRDCILVAGLVGSGLVAMLGLHFIEPHLAITWSFAHLWRHPLLPWIGGALVLVAPVATALAWPHPSLARPLGALSWRSVLGAGLLLAVALLVVATRWPARPVSIDPVALVIDVRDRTIGNGRRVLLIWVLGNLWAAVGSLWRTVPDFIRSMDALLGTASLLALAGCARRLGRSRGEVTAITLLAWSAFGTLQLCIGYLEVYPAELFATTLYLWLALRTIDGDLHPAWPVVAAALAPFWYVSLILLAPSLAVIAVHQLRQRGGFRRLAVAAVLAIVAAGSATIPAFGRPFAWAPLVSLVGADSAYQSGLSPTSSLLPLHYILTGPHARELAHTLLLVDGVGFLLVLVAGAWLAVRRAIDTKAAFLAVVIAGHLPYLVAFDPVFGALCDWDLFSYLAAPASLLGAYAFAQWGRECPKPFAVVLGLALATNGVHLLARLNALHMDLPKHQLETPYHMPVGQSR